MEQDVVYEWEKLPEYIATQQYSRCLGRIFRSLPWMVRRRVMRPMTSYAIQIAVGISGFNAELPPSEPLPPAEREAFRKRALEHIRLSREGLEPLKHVRRASRPDLMAANELLDRIDERMRAAELPPSWL